MPDATAPSPPAESTEPATFTGYGTVDDFFGTSAPPDTGDAIPEAAAPSAPDETSAGETATEPAAEAAAPANGEDHAASADATSSASSEETPSPSDVPAPAWDSEDNPYKAKVTALEVQQKNTRDWTTRVNNENAQMKRAIEILQKKVDGTYDPDTDDATVGQPSPEELEAQARYKGKVDASLANAVRQHGQEQVDQLLLAPDSPWVTLEQDPINDARVRHAESPADEAIQIIREVAFFTKYGRDPDAIVAKIREEFATETQAAADKAAEAKWQARAAKSSGQVTGVNNARGSSDTGAAHDPGPAPTSEIFGAYS